MQNSGENSSVVKLYNFFRKAVNGMHMSYCGDIDTSTLGDAFLETFIIISFRLRAKK